MTQIPGIKAVHAIITPTCRANRGDSDALVEALARVRDGYSEVVAARSDEYDAHVVLTIADRVSSDAERSKSSSASEFPQTSFETGGRNALNLQMALKDLRRIALTLPTDWFFEHNRRASHALSNAIEALQDAQAASDGKEQGAPAREENPFSVDDEYAYFDGPAAKGFEPKRTTDEYYDCLAHEWRQCGALTNGLAFLPWVKYRRRTEKFPSVLSGSKSDNAAGVSSPSPSSSSPATVREQMEPRVHRVAIQLCELCLEGKPGECHTPGCALFLHDSPGHPILPELYEILVPSGIVEQPKKETDLEEKEA